jgi:hypothetical protein
MRRVLILAMLAALPACAVDNEASRLSESCGAFKILPCLTGLFTDHPFHIAVGSLPPGNGFAAGPALTFTHHTKPKHIPGPDGDTTTSWRFNWDGDVVGSANQSWRAGVYMKARYTREDPTKVVDGPAPSGGNEDLRPKIWIFSGYAETSSLQKLMFYGIGQGSSRTNLVYYGMRETIVGGNAAIPLSRKINLKLFGEANARVVSIRPNTMERGPSIEQVFAPASFDVGNQRAFAQFGEGIRMAPALGDRIVLNYAMTFQEFASGSKSSFERLVLDLGHEYRLHTKTKPAPPVDFNGPNSCLGADRNTCPEPGTSRNLVGSLGVRFVLNESFVPAGNSVPFYFQPTLGGSNINGENFLPSYADYRFRGPNMMVVRESFEHSIGKLPVGFIFLADQGKVGVTRDFAGGGLAHSFGAGLTLRAGGFPVLSVLFAWGGKEGTHTLAQVSTSLLGGGGRPQY